MGMRKFKEQFYKYIDKKDFALAVSVVFSMFVSTALSSIYNYLDDKEKMYLQRAEHPPKRINVKFISFAEYEYMTNPDNWKPAILRNADEEMVNEYRSKMSAVMTSLMNQKSIQKLTKSDKLAIAKSLIAGKFKRENPDVDTADLKEEEMVNIMSRVSLPAAMPISKVGRCVMSMAVAGEEVWANMLEKSMLLMMTIFQVRHTSS